MFDYYFECTASVASAVQLHLPDCKLLARELMTDFVQENFHPLQNRLAAISLPFCFNVDHVISLFQ